MKEKKIPLRSCVVTRERLPKTELIRVVKTKEGIVIDETGKINGRGAYIKKEKSVIERAKKQKQLSRVLETEISDGIYDELLKIID